ncbi:hypothetical protein GM658_05470 [Pseudoduganella eburnea]|uniref:Uncharacterized protein n=1 Tax=Massilia eburnea TaxID=1776165 RepID=A0A6L6QDB3_9BURK|nr:hypothetical protein [Massilia eburnea]
MDDQDFQTAVDLEADRLLRLSPCELMQIQNHEVISSVAGGEVSVLIKIIDLGDFRHIGVLAERKYFLGSARYARGIKVQLSMQSMDSDEIAKYYV